MRSGRPRRAASAAAQVAVSGLFLYLTVRQLDMAQVVRGAERVNLWILLASLLTKLGGFAFMTLRSRALSPQLAELEPGRTLKSILVAFVGNNVLPLRLGEALRVVYLRGRASMEASAGFALVFLERVLDLQALAVLTLICTPLLWLRGARVSTLAAFLVGATALAGVTLLAGHRAEWIVAVSSRFGRPLGDVARRWFHERVASFASGLAALRSFGSLGRATASTVGMWAMAVASMQLWIWAFGLHLPWYAPLLLLLYVSVGVVLPAAPGFVGTYDFFLQQALVSFGVARGLATAFAFVGHFMAVVPFTVLAAPFVLRDVLRLRTSSVSGPPAVTQSA